MKRALVAIAVLLLAGQAWGATYYVSQAGTGVKDGTHDAPSAVATFNSGTAPYDNIVGDTVYFLDNLTTYIYPASGGAAGSPAVLRGDYPGQPCSVAGSSYGVRINAKAYITIQGFASLSGGASSNGILIAGVSDNIRVVDTNVGASGYGISVSDNSTNTYIDNVTIPSTATRWGVYVYGAAPVNLTINGLTVNGGYGVSIANVTGTLNIDNVTVNSSTNAGLIMAGDNATNGVINDYTISGTNTMGVSITNSSGMTFNRLNVLNTTGAYTAVSVLGTSNNITFNDSNVVGNKSDGFLTGDTAHDITFNRCKALGNGNKASTTDGDGFTSHTSNYNININYCISAGNTATGFGLVGTTSGNIYNSVAYGNGGDWSVEGGGKLKQIRGGYYYALTGNNPTTGVSWTVKNSIGMSNYPREINMAGVMKDNVVFDYNLYYPDNVAALASLDGGTTDNTWAEYHAVYEANSLNADPKFTSVADNDFTLLSSSPAINAGVAVGLTSDYAGRNIRGLPDIGAYEAMPNRRNTGGR